MRISVHITTKSRWGEISLLLQSLRTQTFKNWDLVLLDESETPIGQCEFLVKLLNRIKLENHGVNTIRNETSFGVCRARNKLIEQDYFNNDFILRLDDDVILEPDYIKKLIEVINEGYDIASGVTPPAGNPVLVRDLSFIGEKINKKEVDEEGNIKKYGDDCGTKFLQEKILPADEFRSCALIKKEVIDSGVRYPTNLSPVGFREEGFFSEKAKQKGFKIGVHTGAVAYHFQSSSGGCRYDDYAEKVKSDDKYFKKWYKENVNSNKN